MVENQDFLDDQIQLVKLVHLGRSWFKGAITSNNSNAGRLVQRTVMVNANNHKCSF